MAELKIGILIIGSLLWETERYDRPRWRAERLNMAARQLVETKTRYGRLSSTKTYTMTFSESAGVSTAYVVPCREIVRKADDLFEEADRLARAEGLGSKERWSDFGAVGALSKPETNPPVLDGWPEYFQHRVNDGCEATTAHGVGEAPSLNTNGFLNVAWPRCCDQGSPNDCDILLATANAPTLNDDGNYPMPAKIARKWIDAGQADYFRNNVMWGMRTAEDVEIWRHIRAADPAWAIGDEYNRLATILERR
jgi:hypothetical protein